MNNENVYDPNWYMVKNEVDGCLDKICGKLDVLKTSARNLMDVAKNIVFEVEIIRVFEHLAEARYPIEQNVRGPMRMRVAAQKM